MEIKLIYCDESCHLQNDDSDIMVLGAITIPQFAKDELDQMIRNIKVKYGLSSWFEIKWTKVSDGQLPFYKELIDFFFENKYLNLRVLVAKNKKSLNHDLYNNGDYDFWYYKMYYQLLEVLITPLYRYRIFIDTKDTNGGPKTRKLHEVLSNNIYDFKREVIKDIRQINSSESDIMQLVDLFIGAVSYYHRFHKLPKSGKVNGKGKLINYLRYQYNINLDQTSRRSEEKFNIFIWEPRK